MMKNQKGITLIALVITIIVLLILAGISIAMLAGENGLLTQATKSGYETKIAEDKEMVALVINELTSEYYEQKYVRYNETVMTQPLGSYVGAGLAAKLKDYAKITAVGDNYKIETISKDNEGKVAVATFNTTDSTLTTWTMETPSSGTTDDVEP